MGYGQYSYQAHRSLTVAREKAPTQAVFSQRECHPLMNPHGVDVRECRDSPEHPKSLGVIFAMDVTGSMGVIPEQLARTELPGFVRALNDAGVADPQVLFMAIGDAFSDRAPLQVGQFESTAELMDQWLTACWLEGGGGSGEHESYELALYFAAHHTRLDCVERRNERGYLFLTGDELPYPRISRHAVRELIGDELADDLRVELVVREVMRSYKPFFLIPGPVRARSCERKWRDLLGDNVICMSGPEDTCLVAAGIVAIDQGSTVDAIAEHLASEGTEPRRVAAVARALLPYAATLRRDGAPVALFAPDAPLVEDGASGITRIEP